MTIVVTGAGSGGHVTPLLAVAKQIKDLNPQAEIIFIGQKGDSFGLRIKDAEYIDRSIYINAGKFRRYNGAGWRQLLDIKTIALNILDFFKFIAGTVSAYFILRNIKPNVVFVKGGYIGVPVGLAAASRGIKYITHDSDTMPGLANRIIARWADSHAVGMPEDLYSYPKNKTHYVGVPISHNYELINLIKQNQYKEDIGLKKGQQLLLVTGGGLGAMTLNTVILKIADKLLKDNVNLVIVLIAGKENEKDLSQKFSKAIDERVGDRLLIKGFINDLYKYSGAADLIMTRAGATNMAEFAAQAKACIVIPSPHLVGGHQIKNARAFYDSSAIDLIEEESALNNPDMVMKRLNLLLNDDTKRRLLAANLHNFSFKDSAFELAKMILSKT